MTEFESNSVQLSVAECLDRLERLDKQIAECRDNRTWRHLRENRNFFAEQLLLAQAREAYEEETCRALR
jgi:hypothetical protein